ncbi:hypothetical protein MKY20_25080 [Cytobacillus sp. FSL W8-0315]|uniref:hypothetical protein n=1 Tax=Cytobacillus sp. FSL W8-0315 TaxID=2921600 RepID=UPI0030F6DC00
MTINVLKKQSDDNFMEWILDPESKLKQFQDIKTLMKNEYLNDPYDWVVAFSSGKDSTLVLKLLWEMLSELTQDQRHKKVHVVSSDTAVETNKLTSFLHKSLEMIAVNGAELGIEVHLVKPRLIQRYFRHVIGLGVIPPAPGKGFQWCTDRLKIAPLNSKMTEILKQQPVIIPEPEYNHRLTLLLGVRLDESIKRAASIKRHTSNDFFGEHDYIPNARVFHAVRDISTDDTWNFLRYISKELPWGMPVENLEAMYGGSNIKECPVIRSKKELNKSCGNTRTGCWVCLLGGRKDKMLQELIDGGDDSVTYLADWKEFLFDVTFDCRYKDPIKGIKEIEKRVQKHSNKGFLDNPALWHEDEFNRYIDDYKAYERATKGNEKGEYDPGKFSFEMRRMLLEKLFYAQEMAGYKLISDEEVLLIIQEWSNEGYNVDLEELKPINHHYDGAVVIKRDWTINEKETTNKNPIFFVEVPLNMSASELAVYHKQRQRLTGKSIFCFYSHADYSHAKMVYNKATFLVCKKDILTLEEATSYVYEWLYLEGHITIGMDGKSFTKMTKEAKNAALKHLMIDTLGGAIKSLDERIGSLKNQSVNLKTLSDEEIAKLSRRWSLLQKWIRIEKENHIEQNEKINNKLTVNNKKVEYDYNSVYLTKDGQLVFTF